MTSLDHGSVVVVVVVVVVLINSGQHTSRLISSLGIWVYGIILLEEEGKVVVMTTLLPSSLIHVDWRETDSAHIFHADLPGMKKEEVKVHVEDRNTLQISGEHTVEEVVDNNKWHCSERRRGSFMRMFRLPENAKMEEIKCSMEHGVLMVVVPKIEEEEKPKNVRAIDIA